MPEAAVEYYLKTAGVNTTDPRMYEPALNAVLDCCLLLVLLFNAISDCGVVASAKVIALATDRFLASVVNDAKQRALLKQQRTGEEVCWLRVCVCFCCFCELRVC